MKRLLLFSLLIGLFSCSSDGDSTENPTTGNQDQFDREAMLADWADNIIIPTYEAFLAQVINLNTAANTFTQAPDQSNLNALRVVFLDAYVVWQRASMFELGKAEAIQFRNNVNIYPTNAIEIEANISNESGYNLELPSQRDRQGFPALDYMLFGLGETKETILSFYTTNEKAESYKRYLNDLTDRIVTLTNEVVTDWKGGFRDDFVANSGNSSTASVDRLVNDFIFYYEKALRAGKVGIPAGVFSGNPLPTHVEGIYKGDISKRLLIESIDAVQDFFNGRYYGSNTEGESLKSYLDFLNTMKNGTDLAQLINNQFEAARIQANSLNDSFAQQIEEDNIALLSTFDALQLNVVLIKVDMLQALNINVDFVDADGD